MQRWVQAQGRSHTGEPWSTRLMPRGRAPCGALVAFVAFSFAATCNVHGAGAESYEFDGQPAPRARTLHTKYLFHVYGEAGTLGNFTIPAIVHFHDLKLSLPAGAPLRQVATEYIGVEVAIVPWVHFKGLVSPVEFCQMAGPDGSDGALLLQDHPGKAYTLVRRVGFEGSLQGIVMVPNPGVYALTVSNCGDMDGMLISGSVRVRNPYGFLAGTTYHKLPIYQWCLLGYCVLAGTSIGLLLVKRQGSMYTWYSIAAMSIFSSVESGWWWSSLLEANGTGKEDFLLSSADMVSSIKKVYMFMTVLLLALGMGTTTPDLTPALKCKIGAGAACYSVTAAPKVYILSTRPQYAPSTSMVLLFTMPGAVVEIVLLCWILSAASHKVQEFSRTGHQGGVNLYLGLYRLASVWIFASLSLFCFQVLKEPAQQLDSWHEHAFLNDALPQFVSFVVLATLLMLWAPLDASLDLAYGYQPVTMDTEEKEQLTPKTMTATTRSTHGAVAVTANTIGAPIGGGVVVHVQACIGNAQHA